MEKITKTDMNEHYDKVVSFDLKRNVSVNIKKQYGKIIRFGLLILIFFFIGYQIGSDAAKRDRRNTMKIEKKK